MIHDDKNPDPDLTPEQAELAAKLSHEDLLNIDDQLLSECITRWRKVARVVGRTFMKFNDKHPGLPDVFYSQRIRTLVDEGRLESQGNLGQMRYSEIRLPTGSVSET